LFVRLIETGADGFVPASSIGREYFYHDEVRQALVGEESGLAYRLGDPVEVRLVEAIPTAGALRFEMLSEGRKLEGGAKERRGEKPGRSGAPRGKGRPQGKRGMRQQGRGASRKRR
jgi:ribonuclease R